MSEWPTCEAHPQQLLHPAGGCWQCIQDARLKEAS